MNSTQRVLLCMLALLAISSPATTQTPKDKETERAEAFRLIDNWLDSVQVYGRIPAISAGIVSGDDLLWAKGYGTIDAQRFVPATPHTIYSICSISKLFTSVSLMQLYEQDKVSLDEPITKYLSWATIQPAPDSGPITLRGMLTHSAGLPRESDYPYWRGPDFPFPTHEEIMAKISAQTALYPAETYFQYSNLGLTLVGETVAAVSAQNYSAYATQHILEPLGLHDTRLVLPMELYGKQLAVGWGALKRDGTRDLLKPFNTRGITPAAGYTSTVEDLARFASWQFRLLRTNKAEILKSSTLREMQRVQFMDPDWKTTWGLGFAISHQDDHTYIGHGGSCPGYHTELSMRNEDQTAVIAMETGAENPGAWTRAIFAILDKRKGYKFKDPAPATGINLEDYAGRYDDQPWGNESIILPWAGGLAILALPTSDPAGELTVLKPKGNDIFRRVRKDGTEAEELKFIRDASGKVTSYVRFSNPWPLESPLPNTDSGIRK